MEVEQQAEQVVTLQEALTRLANLRRDGEKLRQDVCVAEQHLAFSAEWKELVYAKELVQANKFYQDEADKLVRALVIKEYQATQNKKPLPGASVNLVRVMTFDPQECIKWCQEKAPAMVELQLKPEFKAVAEKLGAPVQVTFKPTAVIATKLQEYETVEPEKPETESVIDFIEEE